MAGNIGWTSAEAVNWDDVSTEAPPPLADGVYRGVFVKAAPRDTKGGKPAISLELSVQGLYGGEELASPRKMFDNLMCSREAAFRIKGLAAAANVACPKSLGLDDVTEFCTSLIEAPPVIFKTKQSTYEGKTNAKVFAYLTAEKARAEGSQGEQASEATEPKPVRPRRAAAGAPAAA